MELKYCKFCNRYLPYSQFSPHPTTKDKKNNRCKDCVSTYNKKRWATLSNEEKNKRISRHKYLREQNREVYSRADKCKTYRNKYGVTLKDYEKQWEQQQYKCAICSRVKQNNEKAFAVDHCHKTNAVRGILCPQCNVDLGRIEKYLKNPEPVDNYLAFPPWSKEKNF